MPARASEREQVNERKRDGAKDREKRREGVKVAWDRVYFQSRENSDRAARTPPSFRTAALDERGGEIGQKLSAASPAIEDTTREIRVRGMIRNLAGRWRSQFTADYRSVIREVSQDVR